MMDICRTFVMAIQTCLSFMQVLISAGVCPVSCRTNHYRSWLVFQHLIYHTGFHSTRSDTTHPVNLRQFKRRPFLTSIVQCYSYPLLFFQEIRNWTFLSHALIQSALVLVDIFTKLSPWICKFSYECNKVVSAFGQNLVICWFWKNR